MPRQRPGPPVSGSKSWCSWRVGKIDSLISAVARIRLPNDAFDGAPAVAAVGRAAVGRVRVDRVVDEHLARLGVHAVQDRGHAGLVDLRAGALRDHARQREADRLADLDARVVRSRRHRAPRRRVQAAALGHDQLDRLEEALVLRDRGIHHRGELRHHVAARVAERRPRLELGARVRAGEVDRQAIAAHRHRAVHVHVAVALRIVVDVDVRSCRCRRASAATSSRKRRRAYSIECSTAPRTASAPWRSAISCEPARAELGRADLRAQVAEEGGRAVVGREQVHPRRAAGRPGRRPSPRGSARPRPRCRPRRRCSRPACRRRCRRGGTGSRRSAAPRRPPRPARTRCSRAGGRRRDRGRSRRARRLRAGRPPRRRTRARSAPAASS